MKTKLITTLKHLSRSMGQVVEHELPLDMDKIYRDNIYNDSPNIHTCGTPACVVGYAALDAELTNYLNIETPKVDYKSKGLEPNTTCAYGGIAIKIWDTMDLLDPSELIADSIFVDDKDKRWDCGEKYLKSKGLDIKDYNAHHLAAINPTAQDAKDWIDTLIAIEESSDGNLRSK